MTAPVSSPSTFSNAEFLPSPEGSHTRFVRVATEEEPLVLEDGGFVGPAILAYETWGELNADRSNAILVFHALSGSHHAAGHDPVGPANEFWNEDSHQGWWEGFIGPGKALNTNRFFVICANWIGGCYGSTGPSSRKPNGKRYGSSFPFPTFGDIVDSQIRLLDALGINRLVAVMGGSLGGMCAIDLALNYPDRVHHVIPIASGVGATVLARTYNFEQVLAIETDPNFRSGNYYEGPRPEMGLTLARMISHKTFISLEVIERRARKEIIQPDDVLSCYELRHRIESYLYHQGRKFVKRFDANTYLRILAAWQNYDILKRRKVSRLEEAFAPCKGQIWLVFSIDSDVCFYPEQQVQLVNALKANQIQHHYITVHSEKGHDSFLLEPDLFSPHISFHLAAQG